MLQLWARADGSLKRSCKKAIRPAIFKWRQPEPALILCAVRGHLRYSLSLRDVESGSRAVLFLPVTCRGSDRQEEDRGV